MLIKRKKITPTEKPAPTVEQAGPRACRDFNGHTCIEVSRDDDRVYYVPLDAEEGLQLKLLNAQLFDERYSGLKNYPVERAAKLYAGFAKTLGASQEAMRALAGLTEINQQEIDMATKQKEASASKKATAAAKAKANSKKAGGAPAKEAKTKTKKPVGEKKQSAAQMFQDLIIGGDLTDDQIFAKVKAKFGLDDKKRGYVKWYRNYLKNQGKNPPAPKEAK